MSQNCDILATKCAFKSNLPHTHLYRYTTGKIERIEERWNGCRLLEGFPFDATRRAVGMASFAATPIFLPPSRRE